MKRILYEVSIIRPLVVFLIVLLHSFTMYGGGWDLPNGIHNVDSYFWLAKFSVGFSLEAFVLIAGYVFAYQTNDLKREYKLAPFAKNKFERLIIPCIIFSIVYYFLFNYVENDFNIIDFLLSVLSGQGHLWFLPMLFWCYLLLWTFEYYKIRSTNLLLILALFSIIPIPFYIPFGLGRVLEFAFYCYGGYMLYIKREKLISLLNVKRILLLSLIYIACILINYGFIRTIEVESLLEKGVRILTSKGFMLIASISGITVLYYIVVKFIEKNNNVQKQWVIELSGICYGMYVFHQFILKGLYYHTAAPNLIGTYWLPWFGLVVTLLASWALTKVTLKTKIGRFLIG